MKVLIINSVCGVGSTGRICMDIANYLESDDIQTCIAYGRDSDIKTELNRFRIGTKFNNIIDLVETRLFDKHGFSSKKATKNFISYIKDFSPDVIHLHNLHGYYINIEILFEYLEKEFQGKIVWTLHDCWPISGHSAFIEHPNFRGEYQNINEYPKTYFFNFYNRNLEKKKKIISKINTKKMIFVTPSKWLGGLVKESFLKEFEVRVINNGVDQDIFNVKKSLVPLERKRVLAVANIWDDRKGLKVINQISEILDRDQYEIVVVGRVKKGNLLSKGITHIEQTDDIEQLAAIYNSSTVFVNPTYQDNYPTTNLEALSCGIPVITFDTGGSGEVIEHEILGKVIAKGDVDGLINAIDEYSLKNNQFEISSYAKKHSKTVMLNQYTELIKELL
ncbi:glycosyltransferase [Vagococcus fluvialis]|uniref:glycosyltransferase n=1 Tax=Vagococcus fluvialis TaxID=2738 RepID=UPI00288E372C|nr:glycosyltransferase [Vagococcus fluvialis]MDT2747773.1 glycosyltransferase [Vagococcus fluvialis]